MADPARWGLSLWVGWSTALAFLSLLELCRVNTHTPVSFWAWATLSTAVAHGLLSARYLFFRFGPRSYEPVNNKSLNDTLRGLYSWMYVALFAYYSLAGALFFSFSQTVSRDELDLLEEHHWRREERPTGLDPWTIAHWDLLHAITLICWVQTHSNVLWFYWTVRGLTPKST